MQPGITAQNLPADLDIIVIGSGLGGLSAALRAAEAGASVLLVEARAEIGGTVAFSGGGIHIWGAESWEQLRERSPLSDPVLGERLATAFRPYVDWLTATGAPGLYQSTALRGLALLKYQIGTSIAPWARREWLDYIAARFRNFGGRIALNTRATGLERLEQGFRVSLLEGAQTRTVIASNVILAAGGFQSDARLLQKHIGVDPAGLVQRAVSENRGDGLALALAVGAAPTPHMDTLYGHLMPAPPCRIDWRDPIQPLTISAFYAEHGIVINAKGQRFVDEGAGELSGETINAAAQQPAGLWVILDDAIRTGPARYDIPPDMLHWKSLRYWRLLPFMRLGRRNLWLDTLAMARAKGAEMVRAPTLAWLVGSLARRGVDAAALTATLADYNAAACAGTAAALPVPKSKAAHPLLHPPFIAVPVGVGVSMTYGGVAIDRDARALDADGQPIPGLFAVPGTAGGVNHLHYAGALAACGAFGMIAADTALRPHSGSLGRGE